jgi:hypothetical protein
VKWFKFSLCVVWFFASLFGPFYVGLEFLPAGWAHSLTAYWWTFPTMLCLVLCTFSLCASVAAAVETLAK